MEKGEAEYLISFQGILKASGAFKLQVAQEQRNVWERVIGLTEAVELGKISLRDNKDPKRELIVRLWFPW